MVPELVSLEGLASGTRAMTSVNYFVLDRAVQQLTVLQCHSLVPTGQTKYESVQRCCENVRDGVKKMLRDGVRQMAQAGTGKVRLAARRRENVRDGMKEKGARWSVQDRWCEMVLEECGSLSTKETRMAGWWSYGCAGFTESPGSTRKPKRRLR
ncbi:hypothetical protein M405DRAFT_845372 [Rhizopogon salebrosus TDB-379]|nr:hypothetical protein M405DRAFT_845372 [Rhizopogon salebrosus TDB-379]